MSIKNNIVLDLLYRENNRKLKGYVYSLLGSENEAEEVAHDAFLKFHDLKNKQNIKSSKAFLFKIAHNLALKVIRRRKIVRFETGFDLDEMNFESAQVLAEQKLISDQEYSVFCDAVRSLPPKCREAFILRAVHKKSFQEISDELGTAKSTIEKHVLKGMRDCQLFIKNHESRQSLKQPMKINS